MLPIPAPDRSVEISRPKTSALSFAIAIEDDAPALASLRTAVAEKLTCQYGQGRWSSATSVAAVLNGLRHSRMLVARQGTDIVGTLMLATKKPWAIDARYFTAVARPLYLTTMAVAPNLQRSGIGRRLLDEASAMARNWPGDAIRLDAFDAAAGAGEFYRKCGYREVGRVIYRNTPLVYFELLL